MFHNTDLAYLLICNMFLVKSFSVLLVAFWFSRHQGFAAGSWSNCSSQENFTSDAYISWPYQVLCNPYRPIDDLPWGFDDDLPWEDTINCFIWKNNELLLNKTTSFEDLVGYGLNRPTPLGLPTMILDESSWRNYDIVLMSQSTKLCINIKLRINFTEFQEQGCQDYIQVNEDDRGIADLEGTKYFFCFVESSEPALHEMENVTYQREWLRNCSTLPEKADPQDDELVITPVEFDDAGVYTCSVTYNGMTRYIIQQNICVQHPIIEVQPSLECATTQTQVQLGTEAKFHCLANFGEGTLLDQHFSFKWRKVLSNGTSLNLQACNGPPVSPSDHVSCTFNFEKDQCYLHIASPEERVLQNATVPLEFVIRNVNGDDFGLYNVTVIRESGPNSLIHTVQLSVQQDFQYLQTGAIVAIAIAALLLFVIVFAVAIALEFYLKVFFKRYFGKYDPDDKMYGAFLVYNFSKDLDKFAKEKLKTAIINFRELLEAKGYQIYDERKDGMGWSNRAENMSRSVAESHRVIIFITHSFIKDDWSILAVQQGFEETINAGSKLIFVLFPGMKAYVENHADDDETCRLLQRAIKLHYDIECPKNNKALSFRLQLEGAMPKLRSQLTNRKERLLVEAENLQVISNNDGGMDKN